LGLRYRGQSIRLPWWDYSQAGWYFVTVCTKDRQCVLGKIVEGSVVLSPAGLIVEEEWRRTATVRHNVSLDEFVVMPNHVHGIVVLTSEGRKTSQRDVSTRPGLRPDSLGAIVGQFKSICTKRIPGAGFSQFGWQPRFYEHIIRDERSLGSIRQYILDNPAKWELDDDNPKNYQKNPRRRSTGTSLQRGDDPR
jgi:REP element-mobilizing transposase RayT